MDFGSCQTIELCYAVRRSPYRTIPMLPTPSLRLAPVTWRSARQFVSEHHRHHVPPRGHRFSIAVNDEAGNLVGVAIVGRPVARHLDDGWTVEVTRCCTLGASNACSMLYGAARRIAKEIGYKRIITYTLATESGASLRAAGWTQIAETEGGSWHRTSRPRNDRHPLVRKHRWECLLS